MGPRVSVLVTTYNRTLSVQATIRSVLAQTFADYDIIAVDDGSTDGTYAELSQFGDRIRLDRQRNQGVAASRNTGVRLAREVVTPTTPSDR